MRLRLLPAACLAIMACSATRAAAQTPFECQTTIQGLMAEREAAGKALQAANKRKADVRTACGLLKNYVAVETKFMKYVKTNKTACGVPDNFLAQLTKSHTQASTMTTKVCQIAANGGNAPRPPSAGLSEALGVNTAGSNSGDKPSAVFDTLHGNVLAQ